VSDLQRYFQEKWDAVSATEALYYKHDLTPESIVFDTGGYKGEWSEVIARTYDPHIFIFEPVGEFALDLMRKLSGNKKIRVLEYGLGPRTELTRIYRNGSASSLYRTSPAIEKVHIRDIPTAVCEVLNVESVGYARVDLVCINIEGAEYDLLQAIFDSGLAHRFREIMIQFHPLFPDSYDRWKQIRNQLLETHEEVWGFPFCWEKWRAREWQK
jgi:FkbM family methyltransferase